MALSIFYAQHDTVTPNYEKHIKSTARIRNFKAGEIIKLPGERKKMVYFVANGLLETYTIDKKNRKRIVDFTWENQCCSSTTSTYFTVPLDDFIACIEATTVLQFPVESLVYTITNFSEGLSFYKKMLKQNNKKSSTHSILMQINNKLERLKKFQEVFKTKLARLSTEQQADYLSIHRSTFFDARKNNLKK